MAWLRTIWLCVAYSFSAPCLADSTIKPLAGYQTLDPHDEQVRAVTFSDGVRCVIDAPLERGDQRTLVIYATPNGNTLEQTWGCKMQNDRDWHFDIQHVAAQMRALRSWATTRAKDTGCPKHELWFAVIQAPQLSWPAYRAQYRDSQEKISGMIAFLQKESQCQEMILAAHSGGGAFILDSIQAQATLPDSLGQILFLDANYSYEDELHAEKLMRWLKKSPKHSLTVLAYDDREIMLNDRKVVSETGGTYRATERMRKRIGQEVPLVQSRIDDFVYQTGLNGQVSLAVHQNPANKILHTALVGEMNGLEAAIKLHWTRIEQPSDSPGVEPGITPTRSWPGLHGARDYVQWVATEPIARGAFARLAASSTTGQLASYQLSLPIRATDALFGSAFAKLLQSTDVQKWQSLIATQLAQGNVPERCRQLVSIDVEVLDASFQLHTGRYHVTPDYLSIGSDQDYFRIPMQPGTAWKLSQLTNSSMITAKIVDDLHACATWRLKPHPLTDKRESAETFWQHQELIQHALEIARKSEADDPVLGIISGIKKDLVLTERLQARSHRVAIYGWHSPDGVPIQPLYVGHVDHYVDYSHGVRLMANQMLVDGQARSVAEILNDANLCPLLTREGPLNSTQIVKASQWQVE